MQTRRPVQISRTITPTKAKLDALFAEGKEHDGGLEHGRILKWSFQTQEVGGLVRCDAGNHGAVHGGQDGQRSALPGYDSSISRLNCEFEEIGPFVVHEKWPNRSELAA